jgi:large subunit ribosomal protein L3
MDTSLAGRKVGMTRVFTEDGASIPVTVIEVLPNKVTQIKTVANEGYQAIQVTTGSRKRSRVNKPQAGHFAKANVEPGRGLWEFRADKLEGINLGTEFTVDKFTVGQLVDVTGTTKGKGFAGTVKRWHFSMGDATHGNSLSHRAPGSIGQRQSPGKVFKGKKMSGHLGNVTRTVLSQKIIRIDVERNLLLVSGAVPGAPGGDVIVRSAIKDKKKSKKKSGGN